LLRVLPLVSQAILQKVRVRESLRLKGIHHTWEFCTRDGAGDHDKELTLRGLPGKYGHRQTEIFDFFRRRLRAVLALKAANPEKVHAAILGTERRRDVVLAERLIGTLAHGRRDWLFVR
jgi:hypothetical protein